MADKYKTKLIYHYYLEARTPVFFGDSTDKRHLVRNASDQPMVLGSAIGGALREYMQQTGRFADVILHYMGGEKKESGENDKEFVESRIYISDGKISIPDNRKIDSREGTAIDPGSGTALRNNKYIFDYLPAGTEISFQVEYDDDQGADDQGQYRIDELIREWARGIIREEVRLGGNKTNGFGVFKLKRLKREAYVFDSLDAIEQYIARRKATACTELSVSDNPRSTIKPILFSLKGDFPYGFYQAYTQDKLHKDVSTGSSTGIKPMVTGMQQDDKGYYIPSSSIRGVVRSEVAKLIMRMLEDVPDGKGLAEQKCEEMFGSKERIGKLWFNDIYLQSCRPVVVERAEAAAGNLPVYIKIDRLTGGAFESALKHQQEMLGEADIQLKLADERQLGDRHPYVFPLIYVLRRIGAGSIPLGGRTAIGLGQFSAGETVVRGSESRRIVNQGKLSEEDQQWLKERYDIFKRWCKDNEPISPL